jgi:hypothetical protein
MLHHIDAVIFCTSAVNKFSLFSHPPILLLYSIHLQLLSFKTQEKLKKKVNASVMDKLENAENEYVELNKKKLVSIHNRWTGVSDFTGTIAKYALWVSMF